MSGLSFPAGKARRIFFLSLLFLFLVSTSRVPFHRLRKEGSCYYTHTISLLGRVFSFLGLLFFLKHSEGVLK
jgi:hypothetical protein